MEKQVLYFKSRELWRKYLEENFEKEKEVYFVFPRANSNEEGVSYNDAVEEALCFGWIDGVAGKLDENHQLRRFTPRKKGSSYSRLNIERLIFLNSKGLIHPKIAPEIKKVIETPFVFPNDILDKIKQDEKVWKNFNSFSDSYKRIRIAHIEEARNKPEEFEKRLNTFINKTRENKIISGYGGSEKYYK